MGAQQPVDIVAGDIAVLVDGREFADRREARLLQDAVRLVAVQHVRMAVEKLREPRGSRARRAKEKYKPCWSDLCPHASGIVGGEIHQGVHLRLASILFDALDRATAIHPGP